MSGLIGHTLYAILGAKAAEERKLPLAPLLSRHWPSYLAGAYLGCDVQTMPEAYCVDTGQEVGYGTAPLEKSPLTGGAVRPYYLVFKDRKYRPGEIHERFYGRSHLTFGWSRDDQEFTLPWQHLPEFCAAVVDDALTLFGPGHRPVAYVFGWMAHLIGDGLIKSIWPGVDLHLLDGTYTPRNRPVQDLVSYHEIGRKELGLDWPSLLTDLAETPVEPVQSHYMRVGAPRGRLGEAFPDGWAADSVGLLQAVLVENRRYLKRYKEQILDDMKLTQDGDGWHCREALRLAAGGLDYPKMVEEADRARFRKALWQIAEAIADLFGEVSLLATEPRKLSTETGPSWGELARRWTASRG